MPLELEPNENQTQAETTDEHDVANLDIVESWLVPLIVQTVAERLTELEPEAKEAVLPVVQDIVTVVAELQQFSIDEAEPEIVEAAEAQCEGLIMVLLETLGIEYEEEGIKAFMSIVLRPDFQPSMQAEEVIEADLEHDGTREAKRHFTTQFTLVAAEARLQQLLGTFALFYIHLVME